MSNLYGTNPNQVPLNSMLGNLAFQDKAYLSVDKVGIGTTFVDSGTSGQILQVYGGGAYVSGSVGIGTTNPISTLSVVGDTLITGNLNVGTGGTIITTTGIGSVGIGSTQPTAVLDINVPVGYVGNSLSLPLIGFSTLGQINIGRYAGDSSGINGYFFNNGPAANQRHGMSTRYASASNGIAFWALNIPMAGMMNSGFFVDGTYGLGWSSGNPISNNPDTFILRDAANT